MSLDLLNNILNNAKENNLVQNFIKELSNHIEKQNNEIKNNSLKQDDCLYQVVEMDTDGAYLKNIDNNQVSKENDISKDVLDKIGNDTILRYKNGNYIIEEDMTQKFFDSLIGIKEYKEIQEKFINESNIVQIDPSTKYKVQERQKDYTILNYKDGTIKVPNELIPFFTNNETILYYKDGKFNRDI